MGLLARIDESLKVAIKAGNQDRLRTLRMVKSDLIYKKKELGRELTDDDIIAVLSSAAKKRSESIEEYSRGGRDDLVAEESIEFEIIKEFLPEQLSADKLGLLIDDAIAEANAESIKDIGAVMKALMPRVRGRADGKAVNIAVKERLMKK